MQDETSNGIKIGIWIVIGLAIFLLLWNSFFIVNAGERAILITLGNPQETPFKEGLHFKMPIVQKVVLVDIKTQKYEAKASAASKDLQVVSTDIAVNYHLTGESVTRLYKEIGLDYGDKVIQPAVQEVVKASTAEFSAEELITRRDSVKQKIDIALADRLIGRGITMETTSITNFDFSPQFNTAVELKVTAEQTALAAKNKLAQIQYEAQQVQAAAIGQRDAAIAQAEGHANATLVIARAEAERLRLQKEQITELLIQKQMLDKWSGVLPQYMIITEGSQGLFLQLPKGEVNSTG
jgi:regulator of protease activity HflC (stomatin/prohibitin superfamily)